MRVLIVRHGETDENRRGIIQGQLDAKLNQIGVAQSRLVGKALSKVPFTHAFCSPLQRAARTYDEIHRYHPDLKCIYHDDIKEYHCGRLQGFTRKQALAICAKEGITYEEFRKQGGADSWDTVIARIERFWKKEILSLRKTDSIVLIVSHGGIISTLRKYLLARNYHIDDSLMTSSTDFWEVRNCSITEISVVGEKGPGMFVRMGAWEHLFDQTEELADSTG